MGYVDGVVASCTTLVVQDRFAGQYDVVAKPEFRGRGARQQTVAFALRLAADLRPSVATLQSYPKATGFYHRLGFEQQGTFAILYDSRTRMRSGAGARP